MGGLGSVVGLLLGGALTEYLSWRWVLFINAPIAVLVLIGTGVLVSGDTERGPLDIPGAVAATLGIGSLIYALTRGNTNGWTDAGTLVSFAAGAVLLVAYLPFVAGVGVASGGLGPRLLGALPARAVIAAGMLLCAGGLAWYAATLTPTSNYVAVMLPAMLAGGIGTGLTFVGCTVTGMLGVAPRDTGVAAGLLNTSVQTGSALGLGALAAIASIVTRNSIVTGRHTVAVALTDGYVAGLLAGSIIFAAGALVAALTIDARLTPAEAAGR